MPLTPQRIFRRFFGENGKTILRKRSYAVDERLKEQNFGIFEGKTYEELAEEYPLELERWNVDYSHYRITGGESFSDVRKRAEDFLRELQARQKELKNVLLVAHKGSLGHFRAACLHMPLDGYWNFVFEQGCYSCVDLEDGYAIIRKLNQSADGR